MNEKYFLIFLASTLSFFVTFVTTPIFIGFFRKVKITGKDLMKKHKPSIPEMGGPCVLIGFLAGIFFFIGVELFIYRGTLYLLDLLASISTILIIEIIGIFEVLTSLITEKKDDTELFKGQKRRGIARWLYFIIPLPAAVPLMAVNAGVTWMVVPFVGRVNLGVIYPLMVIPFAVLLVPNATNFLAGFNGLEAGMGSVLLIALGIYTLINERVVASTLAFTFAATLLAFIRYNWYPAQIFPGDLNYIIGAVTVSVAVLGNIEKFSIICFTPWIIESFLKVRSRFQAESYGMLQEDGTVKAPYPKIYSLTHVIMKIKRLKESEVSFILIITEVCICIVAFWLYFMKII